MGHRVRFDLHPLILRFPDLGNPLESEQAAFRWLVAVLLGTGLVIVIALAISRPVGLIVGLILVGLVTVSAVKGIAGMLRPPDPADDDEESAGSGPGQSG